MPEDGLTWLLPEASAEERAEVRRMLTAMRLLRDDARGRESRRAPPSWVRARAELEHLTRRERRRAIDALLHAYLSALRAPDSFLELGPSAVGYEAAWRVLLSREEPGTSPPPAPAEAPLAVVERLLAAGLAHGAQPHWRAYWGACCRHVSDPIGAVERTWQTLFAGACAARAGPVHRARLLRGWVAARLDRFRPRRAFELCVEHAPLSEVDPSLRRLCGWSALLCGEWQHARDCLHALPAAALPGPMAELREDLPEWAERLAGASRPEAPPVCRARTARRRDFGALLLGVFARRPDGRVEIVALDASAAVRAQATRRLAAWDSLESGAPRRLRLARAEVGPLPEALAGQRTRALARAGVHDSRGELAGWIQVESEHLLLPSAASLADLTRAWAGALPVASAGSACALPVTRAAPAVRAQPLQPADPRQEFVARLFAALGPLAGLRAFWIEPETGGTPCVRAERGAALEDWSTRRGGAGMIRRAFERRTSAQHRGEAGEGLHAAAGAGCALPYCARTGIEGGAARVLGLLVLESRATDEALDPTLLESARATLAALEPLWWATAFRAACRSRLGFDLAWDPRRRFLACLEPALAAAAVARAPVLIVGPPGAGRRTFARWLHFRGPEREEPFGEETHQPCAGTRVQDLAGLGRAEQLALARGLEHARWLFLAQAPAHVLRARGELAPELERLLDPLPFVVPPLCTRRDEIPALARVLADNVAWREELSPLHFSDEALGAIWRQDWRGNVSELAALVAQLARAHAGQEIASVEVCAAMRARALRFRERLPSLRPRALDLALALEATRHQNGSENRARAARYLGWDPETLAARLSATDAPGSEFEDRRGRPRPDGSGK